MASKKAARKAREGHLPLSRRRGRATPGRRAAQEHGKSQDPLPRRLRSTVLAAGSGKRLISDKF